LLRHHKISPLVLSCLLLCSASAASAELEEIPQIAYMNWDNNQLCLPVEFPDESLFYDACFSLISVESDLRFEIRSLRTREERSVDMATYSPDQGLKIPVVRTSRGQTFVNARLVATDRPNTLQLLNAERVLLNGQHSIARQWNEQLLEAIRHDAARPTVHARNLFHTSMALYDAWAAYDISASPYLLGKTLNGFTCSFAGLPEDMDNSDEAMQRTISYAAYRLLSYRFKNARNAESTLRRFRNLMLAHHYDPDYTSTSYVSGDAAALGNYIAQCIIDHGLEDGSYELDNYPSHYYTAKNPPLAPMMPGSQRIRDPNYWQPLSLKVIIDDKGMPHYEEVPKFLGSEWGQVVPFALDHTVRELKVKDGNDFFLYHDPGAPPHFDTGSLNMDSEYVWNFTTVALWSSHLDPSDGVEWEISPASMGNLDRLPENFEEYKQFFNQLEGGDASAGHALNPATGQPYGQQWVPRGDFTRVLAEFWADGPDSETPPGHWFVIFNEVSDHPMLVRRFEGSGEELDRLEWDIKAYFTLGGAMHDAALSAWSIKSWYDYVRPISAIRYLAEMELSEDEPLVPGYIERVGMGDALAGEQNQHVGKIKLRAWRGPDYIEDPANDFAGVGWILAENWWPYQRPSFVTPPFAGYISGHSTFSAAAAEVLTLLTGDPYFPGGIGEFVAKKNQYLKFEAGPSVDVKLQWATYRDASDQTSLSRIWGGIHPPVDDIPGRRIGRKVGADAFARAKAVFAGAD
jgi:hypothetical protein